MSCTVGLTTAEADVTGMSGSDEAVRGKPNQLGKARWMRGGGQEEDEAKAGIQWMDAEPDTWPALQVWSVLEVGGAVVCEGMVRSRSSKAGWQQPDGGGGSMHKCFTLSKSTTKMSRLPPPGPFEPNCSPHTSTTSFRAQLLITPPTVSFRAHPGPWSEDVSIRSSSSSTLGLSYSPTPTESSLGGRNVQMTTFMDVSTSLPGLFTTFAGAQNDKGLAMWSVPSNGLDVAVNEQDAEEGDVVEEDRETLAVEVAGQSEGEMEEDMEDSDATFFTVVLLANDYSLLWVTTLPMSLLYVVLYYASNYALQKLSTFDYVELWYFTHAGRLDAAKFSNKSQADDTFGISRVDDHLTVHSIASVRASHNVLSDHDLSFSEFLRAKNVFLDHARKAEWPIAHLDTLAKFFWLLETHSMTQLPLRERIILTYALRVHLDWHRELKANRGYDISITNQNLLRTIADEVRALDDKLVKIKVSLFHPIKMSTFLTPSLSLRDPHF
ncbi:hypothetical protein EV363DRAFT_1301765 [Boletus edulis]|nr:hypothetical protein EV363DRAFT_1301765 [Boletus edulis]